MTYNHEAFIARALDGFVMQETSFAIEVVVHDDASTDNTAAIVRRYEAEYPELFVCEYEAENQYSKQGHGICNDIIARKARGRYIALCEGDDYWIDAKKLEKQVAFMERNPGCAMSFHAARIEYADGRKRSRVHRYPGRGVLTPREVILGGGGYETCTAVFRREVFDDYPAFLRHSPVGDIMLALNAISKGTVAYLDEVMAVYSCGIPGSFTQRASNRTPCENLEFYRQLSQAQAEFDKYTRYKFSKWITRHRSKNAALTLASGACQRGCYEQYRVMRTAMLPRHRFLFHLGYIYFRLKGLVLGPVKGRTDPGGYAAGAGKQTSRGW